MFEAIFSYNTLRWLMLILYVPACVGLIVVVLLQKGKGSGFAGAFGIGPGSDAVFGPRASKSLPVRLTYIMAGVFVVLALGLSIVEGKVHKGSAPELIEEEVQASALQELGLGEAYQEDAGSDAAAQPEGLTTEDSPEAAQDQPSVVPVETDVAPPPETEAGAATPDSAEETPAQ